MAEISVLERKKSAPATQVNGTGSLGNKLPWTDTAKRLALMALACLLASLITTPAIRFSTVVFRVNEIAEDDIRATRNFLATNLGATEVKRREAYQTVRPVYEYSPNALDSAIAALRNSFESPQAGSVEGNPVSTAEVIKNEWSVTITRPLAEKLSLLEERRELENYVSEALGPYYRLGVVANRDMLIRESEHGITIRNTVTGIERPIVEPRNAIDYDTARKELSAGSRRNVSTYKDLARIIAAELIRPNLVFNAELTEKRRVTAASEVAPVLYQVKKGEILVREGDRVTPEQEQKLEVHSRETGRAGISPLRYFMLFLALFFLTGACLEYGRVNIRKTRTSPKDLAFVAFTFLGMLLLQRIGAIFADRVAIGGEVLVFAMPMAAALVTVRVVLNSETALVTAIPYLVAVSIGSGLETGYFFPLLIGAIVGAHVAGRVSRRVEFLRIGVWTGVAQASATMVLLLYKGSAISTIALWQLGAAFTGGMLTGVAALGLVPLAEIIFGYSTDMRLMELASLDHPLLRDLMIRAPGTYHHSMVTGTLVKGAAEAIGARSVLATVACYFHDIGKINKAAYFIENQEPGKNPHDKLTPSMSALILISHVKEGVELAQKYRLGKDIEDIIHQHHGTALIRYFHRKAVESARPGIDEISESEYRYPGPKPQTREAALVMLADAVEAAARSIPDHSSARIQGVVQNLINRIFADGQLDECDLALKDLHNIAGSFMHTLSGIHHQRIDYPLAAHKEKRDDGSPDPKRQPDGRGKRGEAEPESEESLKRLGL